MLVYAVQAFSAMCVPPQTKKQEQYSGVHNVTQCCVLPHVAMCMGPNCILWEMTDKRREMLNTQIWVKFKIGFVKPLCEFIQKGNNAQIIILNCLYN